MSCLCQEGDLYDPAGTITGGSAPKGGNTLMKLQELSAAERATATAVVSMGKLLFKWGNYGKLMINQQIWGDLDGAIFQSPVKHD